MGNLGMHPPSVSGWAGKAHGIGDGVTSVHGKVRSAGDDGQSANLSGLGLQGAFSSYIELFEGTVRSVGGGVQGVGGNLSSTANIVTTSDQQGATEVDGAGERMRGINTTVEVAA